MNEDNVKEQSTEESSAGSEKVPATAEDIVGAWELCPVCKGTGTISYTTQEFAWSYRHTTHYEPRQHTETCSRCNGDRYVFRPVLPTTARDPSTYPTRSE